MRILFVCRWNRFRSRIAEAYFNKINSDKALSAKSAGMNGSYNDLDPFEVNIAHEMGLTLQGVPRQLDDSMLENFDKVIIVANDIPATMFSPRFAGKLEFWDISDQHLWDPVKCKAVIRKIMEKVDEFYARLEKR